MVAMQGVDCGVPTYAQGSQGQRVNDEKESICKCVGLSICMDGR